MIRWIRIPSRIANSCALAALVGLAGFALPAAAQNTCGYTVTSLADPGTTGEQTLRNGIASGASTICFQTGLTGTITLASTLSITSGVSIIGPGIGSLGQYNVTISGNRQVQVFSINAPATSPVSISYFTITQGYAQSGGGLEVISGNVTLSNVYVFQNTAVKGGGIYNAGILTLTATGVSANSSIDDYGGGIYNAQGATLTLNGSSLTANSTPNGDLAGGGLENQGTTVILCCSDISYNTGSPGAGIDNSSGTLTVSGASFYGNTSKQGGGAIENQQYYYYSPATANITDATFYGNTTKTAYSQTPTTGGAIDNSGGTLVLKESTLLGNTSDGEGGAVYNSGTLTLTQDTITGNTSSSTGSGVSVGGNGVITLTNTIVAENAVVYGTVDDDCNNCGTVPSGNLVHPQTSPLLGPLASNGGTIGYATVMPLPGSAAIGGGIYQLNGVVLVTDPTDERGLSRTTVNGNTVSVDIGAVQTHYNSVSFYTQPTTTVQGHVITPAVQVQVIENDNGTLNYPQGVPVTMELIPTVGMQPEGSLGGTLVQYPYQQSNDIAALFNDLTVSAAGYWKLQATTEPGAALPLAAYVGDSSQFQTTSPLLATATTLTVPASATYGQSVTISAQVTNTGSTAPVQSGTVTFNIDGSAQTPVSVSGSGSASISTATLAAGTHTITANYGGSTTEAPSSTTQSSTISVTKAAPALVLNAPKYLLPGVRLSSSNVQAFATGQNGAAVPGTFSFSPTLCALNSDCPAPQAGPVTVTASFTPTNSTDYSSGSTQATVTVLPQAATSTTLTASPSPALPNTAVTLTATVAGASNTPGVVAGTVFLAPADATFTPLALTPATATFQGGVALSYTGYSSYATYSADFNGDGAADLLIVPELGAPQLLLSDISAHTGAYLPASSLSPGANCPEVLGSTVGDINGDGLPDIALVCTNAQATTLVVLINQGDATFAISPTLTTNFAGIESAQLVIGDFNNDGLADVIAVTQCSTSSQCVQLAFLQQGVGSSFTSYNSEPIEYGGPSDSFANLLAADFNGDGNLDVAFIHYSNASPYGVVEVWTNNGGSTPSFGTLVDEDLFSASATITAGNGSSTLSSLISGTFKTGDLPDLALVTTVADPNGSDAYSSLSVALNSSTDGTLSFPGSTTDTSTGGAQTSIVTADFDGDGIADLALYNSADNTVRVLHGVGDGTFSSTTEPSFSFTVDGPVASPGVRSPLHAHGATRGIATPGITAHPNGSSQINQLFYPVLAVGDTNGDGFPDILVAQLTSSIDDHSDASIGAQQFITTGPSTATAGVTATGSSVNYTATTSPATPYWASSSGSTTLTSGSLVTTTTLAVIPSSTPATYGGSVTLKATVLNQTGNSPVSSGTVTFTDTVTGGTTTTTSGVPVTNGVAVLPVTPAPVAGTHSYAASYSGDTNTGEGSSSSSAIPLIIAKYSPTLTWATPAQITTTTALSTTQLDASATGAFGNSLNSLGSFVYSPAVGATLPAGNQTLSVTFTPADSTDYATVTRTVTIAVALTNTTTTLAVTPVSTSHAYGQPLTLTANVAYPYGTGQLVQGGTVLFTSTTSGSPGTTTLGSVTVANGTATLSGVVLGGGTHILHASYGGDAAANTSTAATQIVTITPVAPTLHWTPPAAITTSTSLGSTQLDASATGVGGVSLTGSFVYTPAAGATLPFGTQTLSVTFTPTDTADYTTATTTVPIDVGDSTPVTTLSASSTSPVYGQALTLTAHLSNGQGTAAITGGTVTFTSGGTALGSPVAVSNGVATLSGVSLGAGAHLLGAAYSGTTGENPGNPATLNLTVAKATPTLTWATPAAISSTTPLSAEQLDATAAGTNGASLPGAFVYTPASGTFSVGSHTLSVTFTPTDSTDYTTASASVTLTVFSTNTQTALTVSPAQITYGQAASLSAQVTNSNGTTVIQAGTVAFAADNVTLSTVNVVNGAASLSGVSLTGGTHLLTATYSGATGEGASAASRSITVARATPVLSWSTPAQISSTTPLGATQLNASATGVNGAALAGSFAYSPATGVLLTVGTHTLTATFTPSDATDYATATTQVSIQVVAETISLASISPATTPLGTTPLAVTLTGSGFPSTAVVRLNGTALPTTVISATQLGATIPAANLSKAGALSLTIYDAASQAISNAVTLTVTAPTPTVMLTAPATVVSGGQPNVTLALAKSYPVDIAGTFTLTFTPAGPNGVDDPSVQFSTGGRVYNFTIPAGVTTGPTASLQSGTVEGTISVATALNAGGVNVTPPDLATPTDIGIAAEPPTITGVTFTDVNGLITAVVTGFSNTREMASAQFIFTGPGASDLASAGVTIPADNLFSTWYTSESSATFGSSFSYTQTFQLSDPTTDITGVAVTLTNTAGTSASVNSQ